MTLEADIAQIARQEEALQFDSFNADTAWRLGNILRRLCVERGLAAVVDIHINGMPVFYCAIDGTTPDNPNWVRRKRNVVLRFFKSSYAMGLTLARQNTGLEEKFGVSTAEFASHGGSFPIKVKNTGCIGAVTVSGLPQREDHNLAVEALAELLGLDHDSIRLADG